MVTEGRSGRLCSTALPANIGQGLRIEQAAMDGAQSAVQIECGGVGQSTIPVTKPRQQSDARAIECREMASIRRWHLSQNGGGATPLRQRNRMNLPSGQQRCDPAKRLQFYSAGRAADIPEDNQSRLPTPLFEPDEVTTVECLNRRAYGRCR